MRIIVAGIGTDVGKTVVSAILIKAFKAEYWKPIQCGVPKDSDTIGQLTDTVVHKETYLFSHSLAPTLAALKEGKNIDKDAFILPKTSKTLVIEQAGGVMVPLSSKLSQSELALSWDCSWVLVSKSYLGSINHTLLSIHYLRSLGVRLAGVVFNGAMEPQNEELIHDIGRVPIIGRMAHEESITKETIDGYAKEWDFRIR